MPDRTGLPHGYVRLLCDDPPLNLALLMGETAPKVTGGIGGWDVTARPRQVAMTTWGGVEPFQLELPLMLDRHAAGVSVERDITRIVAVGRGDGESEPGILRIQGVALPVVRWVIEGVDFGDALMARTGNRTRQPFTLTLREYVPPAYLQLRRSATLGSKGKTKTLTVRKGDTPAKIAARQRCKWTDIRDLNPGLVRKANQALKTGTKLRVPVAASKARKPATRRTRH